MKAKRVMSFVMAAAMVIGAMGTATIAHAEASEEEQVKLVYWAWNDESGIIDGFMEAHPNIVVEQVFVDAADYGTKLKQALAAGTELPDIIASESSHRGSDLMIDIWDDLTKEPYNVTEDMFLQSSLPGMKNQKGELVSVEITTAPAAIAYKRDLCKEWLGTDDPEELEAMFTTFDDLLAKAKEVAEASNGEVKMFATAGTLGNWFVAMEQISSKNDAGECVFTDKYAGAIEKICALRDAGAVDVITAFSPQFHASYAEDYLFYPTAAWGVNWLIAGNDPEGVGNWGMFTPPGGGYSWGGTSVGVCKYSEHKEEAWEYIRWWLMGEGQELALAKGDLPILKENYENPELTSWTPEHFAGQDIGALLYGEIAPNMKLQTYTEYDSACEEVFGLVVQNIMADNSYTAEQALEDALIEIQNKLPDVVVK